MIIIVDASVAAMWFVRQPHSDRAGVYFTSRYELIAPDLILLEVGNALLKAIRKNEITVGESRQALRSLLPSALRIVPAAEHMETAFEIAQRHGGSIYDAVYISIARSLDALVLTNDRQLAAVAGRVKVRSLMLEDAPPPADS